MPTVHYRLSEKSDVPAMARFRAQEWETEDYWKTRITRYLDRELHPQHALLPRVSYSALEGDSLVGFIAGHLTHRFACDGELEWINVIPERRGTEVASALLRLLPPGLLNRTRFASASHVDSANTTARRFYMRHGAEDLNPHWLVWNDIKVVLSQRLSDNLKGC